MISGIALRLWRFKEGRVCMTSAKLLGHSDVSMTQRYAHMVDDSLQKATDNMAGVIDRAIGG